MSISGRELSETEERELHWVLLVVMWMSLDEASDAAMLLVLLLTPLLLLSWQPVELWFTRMSGRSCGNDGRQLRV